MEASSNGEILEENKENKKNRLMTKVKDEKYYLFRKQNNEAAKRSRERKKERCIKLNKLCILLQAQNSMLMKETKRLSLENSYLRTAYKELKDENFFKPTS